MTGAHIESVDNITNPGRPPVNGDEVRINYVGGANATMTYTSNEAEYVPPPPSFNLSNLAITRNGGLAVPSGTGNKYYLDPPDTVEITGDIVDDALAVQTAIDAPLVKLPVVKYADDQPTAEEFYLTGSIVAGVLTVEGKFPLSGNYKVVQDRSNRALDRMSAGFHMIFEDVDFLV